MTRPHDTSTARPLQVTVTGRVKTVPSTLRKLLAAQKLRRGFGALALPDSRRAKERLMAGRTKILATGVKLELVDRDYDPRKDTCLRASFVRLLAAQNAGAECSDR